MHIEFCQCIKVFLPTLGFALVREQTQLLHPILLETFRITIPIWSSAFHPSCEESQGRHGTLQRTFVGHLGGRGAWIFFGIAKYLTEISHHDL